MNTDRQDGADEPVCGGGTFYALLLVTLCGKGLTFSGSSVPAITLGLTAL